MGIVIFIFIIWLAFKSIFFFFVFNARVILEYDIWETNIKHSY